MDDLIYKISGVYLYDNQLKHDYIILYNRRKSFFNLNGLDLPYKYLNSLNEIYELDSSERDLKSIDIMQKVKVENTLFIKNDGFLTLEKLEETHLFNYNAYNIYWNETKSGINIHDYEVAAIWNIGHCSYTKYRIWEHKNIRTNIIRDRKLNQIFE